LSDISRHIPRFPEESIPSKAELVFITALRILHFGFEGCAAFVAACLRLQGVLEMVSPAATGTPEKAIQDFFLHVSFPSCVSV
jgi:hypothetical protein